MHTFFGLGRLYVALLVEWDVNDEIYYRAWYLPALILLHIRQEISGAHRQ